MNRRELLGSFGAVALLPARTAMASVLPLRPVAVFEASLQLGLIGDGVGKCRRAPVIGGDVTGTALRGMVRSGTLEWLVDPASGAVELVLDCQVLTDQGRRVHLRDHTVHAGLDGINGVAGLATAPAVRAADSGRFLHTKPLAGRLDASGLPHGTVLLRAFEAA
jgi:hypothetical protein